MGGHLVPAFRHWLPGLVGTGPLNWMQMILTAAALAGPGRRFFAAGIPALLRGGPEMNSLVALGSRTAFLFSAIVVLLPGKPAPVPMADLHPGDLVLPAPAEREAGDGTVTKGRGHANESMLTGEPVPAPKEPGDPVTGGTVNGPATSWRRSRPWARGRSSWATASTTPRRWPLRKPASPPAPAPASPSNRRIWR